MGHISRFFSSERQKFEAKSPFSGKTARFSSKSIVLICKQNNFQNIAGNLQDVHDN